MHNLVTSKRYLLLAFFVLAVPLLSASSPLTSDEYGSIQSGIKGDQPCKSTSSRDYSSLYKDRYCILMPLVDATGSGQVTAPSQEMSDQKPACSPKTVKSVTLAKSKGEVVSLSKKLHKPRYKCTYRGCIKSYKSKGTLVDHEKMHAGLYKCTFCGKPFGRLSYLEDHERVHTGEKPFACGHDGCFKKFKALRNLSQHRHIHGAKRYQCKLCPKQYSRRHALKTHLKKKHNVAL